MFIWTQWIPCKVNVTPLRLYFDEPQKNEIDFLRKKVNRKIPFPQ